MTTLATHDDINRLADGRDNSRPDRSPLRRRCVGPLVREQTAARRLANTDWTRDMADDPLPFIEKKDYGEFQRSFENAALPDYDEWFKRQERYQRDQERMGHSCYAVQVDPVKFVEHCRSGGQEPKEVDASHFLVLLLRFAITIANPEPQSAKSDFDTLDSKY